MRLMIPVIFAVLGLAGCAGQGPNQVTEAQAKHAFQACGATPWVPFTPAQRRCMNMQRDAIDSRDDCLKNAAPNQVDRCATQIAKYTEAWRQCGGVAGGNRAVFCATAKEPEGHRWLMGHKSQIP